jgi:alpha-beta hydrolase superfamily lysophospholipase
MLTPRRWIRWLGGAVLCGIVAITAFAYWLGGTFIASANRPVGMPAGFAAEIAIPGEGHAIAASWRDLGPGTPVVLLLHGMGGDRRSTLPRASRLVAAGFSGLLIDLQAHGETPGAHITLGFRESADVRAAIDWLHARAPERRVGVVGVSLGGASFLLAEPRPRVDALVLEAVHPDLQRAVRNRVGPWLAPLLLVQIEPRLGVRVERLDPARHAAGVRAPVLVVGGERDANTTPADTRALFAAAGAPKELWIVPGAAHEDFSRFDPAGYDAHVVAFLRRHLGRAPVRAALNRRRLAACRRSTRCAPRSPGTPGAAARLRPW